MLVRFKPGWHRTYPELTVGNRYRVIQICDDSFRVVDDLGDPVLFPRRAFEAPEGPIPATWVELHEDDALYAGPRELSEPRYFWELWHDGDPTIRTRFSLYLRALCHVEASAQASPNAFDRIALSPTDGTGPTTVYRELDADRWEIRKVEAFADGRLTYAGVRFGASGATEIDEEPIAALDPLADSDATAITADEFEAIWDRALAADATLAHE